MKYFSRPSAIALLVFLATCGNPKGNDGVNLDVNVKPLEKLSDYRFFKTAFDLSKPNKGVIPFKLVNTMFNDLSIRETFMYTPSTFDSNNLLNLPAGSCLINAVYYWKDERNDSLGKQLIETQLLIKKQTGWEPLNYIWDADQKDATLSDGGGIKSIAWKNKEGLERKVNFEICAKNECRGCHLSGTQVVPIEMNADNLNFDGSPYTGNSAPNWKDTSLPLEKRAHTYLNANCAYCHNPTGPAFVSGLFLNADNDNHLSYGICKQPLSRGHSSCNLQYDILPGKPAESVMVCRMASTEFGVKMPERGRTTVDTAGVALITNWIAQLKPECP